MNKNNLRKHYLIKNVPIKHLLSTKRSTFILLFTFIFCSMAGSDYTQNAILTKNMSTTTVLQQKKQITGKIVDANGEPIIGANIIEIGTYNGTVTNIDGNFSLNVSDNATIRVSYIGYVEQEIKTAGKTTFNITLLEDTKSLEEVVVVGYGVQKKLSVTNAISSAKVEDVSARNSINVNQALQGRLPGLTVIDYGGAPGGENLNLMIRGITSLNDNWPLVLVDGIPGDITYLNPNDIESISVLKDAASAAIYGSRAAAGVILVTTKSPSKGKLSIQYNGVYGFATPNNKPIHMDAVTYMKQQNAAYENTYGYKFYTDEYIQQWPTNHAKDPELYPLPNTWQDEMYVFAPQYSHNLALSGGNDYISNWVSFRYLDQKGVLPNYGFNITELRIKNDFTLSKKIKLSSNINISLNNRDAPVNEWESYYRMWQNSQWGVPYYKDGSYGLSVDSYSPLVNVYEMGTNKVTESNISEIFRGEYRIINDLIFSAQYSTKVNYYNSTAFRNKYDIVDKLHPERRTFNTINSLTEYRWRSRENEIDLQLAYDKTVKKNKISGLLGYSQIHYTDNNLSGYRQDFYNNELQSISMGADDATQAAWGGDSEWALRSYFMRLNYEFNSKYLFEANARYDGSSRFAEGNRYGFFPSFSSGWRISEESFWDPLKNTINELKVRASWGKVGNQQVGLYSFMETYHPSNYLFNKNLAIGYRQRSIANKDISWETTTQLNIGVDGYILNNKINFSMDYYKKNTNDILLTVPIPTVIGLNPSPQNAGSVENRGMEFVLGGRGSIDKVKFDISFNANYNKNKVLDLANTGPYISAPGNSDYRTITDEGLPINSFYGFKTDGFFQTQEEVDNYAKWDGSVGPGDVKYIDINKDGALTPDDFVVLGHEMPDWTFSSNMGFLWKNFRFDLFWQGVSGSKKPITGAILEQGIWGGFTHKEYADYWTPDNTDAKYPRPTKYTMKNVQMSDLTAVNGSYLRLKNVKLTYNLPQVFCSKIHLRDISIFLTSTNLLTFAELNKLNIDPEMIGRGQESSYPQTSVTTIGLNINF